MIYCPGKRYYVCTCAPNIMQCTSLHRVVVVVTDAVDDAIDAVEEAVDVVAMECVEDAVNDTVDAVEDVSVEGSTEGVTGECW